MGRSDDQRAGMIEHYRNIWRAATLSYHISGARAQRDKPFTAIFRGALNSTSKNWRTTVTKSTQAFTKIVTFTKF
jgi:hypothetical protein